MAPSLARPNRLYNQAYIAVFFISFVLVRVPLSISSMFCCSWPVLFSHPKTNPPKGWRRSILLRKQCHSSYLCNHGPVIPGMPRLKCPVSKKEPTSFHILLSLKKKTKPELYFFLPFFFPGASWRGFFPLHCLQWWKCVRRIEPKGKWLPHLLFLPFTRVYKPISAA